MVAQRRLAFPGHTQGYTHGPRCLPEILSKKIEHNSFVKNTHLAHAKDEVLNDGLVELADGAQVEHRVDRADGVPPLTLVPNSCLSKTNQLSLSKKTIYRVVTQTHLCEEVGTVAIGTGILPVCIGDSLPRHVSTYVVIQVSSLLTLPCPPLT